MKYFRHSWIPYLKFYISLGDKACYKKIHKLNNILFPLIKTLNYNFYHKPSRLQIVKSF